MALASEPTAEQMERTLKFLAAQEEFAKQLKSGLTPEELKNAPFSEQPKLQALAMFCQFLMSNNEFLYVD